MTKNTPKKRRIRKTHKIKTLSLVFLLVLAFVIAVIPIPLPVVSAAEGWTLTTDAREMKAYPDLKEYVWQKNASLAPNGPYDKIGLHRLVKTGITPKGVLFICPGTWSSGEQLISNPLNDTWTKYENDSQPIYWANRGFDIYSIDYRTHFVPIMLSSSQLSFMENWGWDQWISDIKECVNKAKEVSGAKKIFMAGESFGGLATTNYATKYWREDLRGIILLDGGNATKNQNPTNSYNLTAMLSIANTTSAWSTEYPNVALITNPVVGAVFLHKYALANPGAPAQYPPGTPLTPIINPLTNKTWTNITEWYAFITYYAWTYPGGASNTLGGYGNATLMLQWGASSDRYWSTRLTIEYSAIKDWANCPYVTYDFDDHYSEIDVPLLGYTSGLYGFILWGPIGNIANSDITRTVLQNYGHGDVFAGVYTARDVSAPTYAWMVNHTPLALTSSVWQSSSAVTAGNIASFLVTTVIGGIPPYTYQWYQGTSPVGNNYLLAFYPNTPGTFMYYCKITDAEGTTANSNMITLTVNSPQTPTPAPTPTSTPTPPPTPTPTPSLSPTTSESPSPTPSIATTNPLPEATYAVAAIILIVVILLIALVLKKRAK